MRWCGEGPERRLCVRALALGFAALASFAGCEGTPRELATGSALASDFACVDVVRSLRAEARDQAAAHRACAGDDDCRAQPLALRCEGRERSLGERVAVSVREAEAFARRFAQAAEPMCPRLARCALGPAAEPAPARCQAGRCTLAGAADAREDAAAPDGPFSD